MKEIFTPFQQRGTAMLALVSALVTTPAVSFADTGNHTPLTRADVRRELVDLEAVGYDPTRNDDATYPEDLLDAEKRLAQKQQEAKQRSVLAGAAAN